MNRKTVITLTLCTSALFSNNLMAHGGATGIVKERMDQMVVIKKSVKKLAAVYKGRVDYNADTVRKATKVINDNAGVALTSLYPEGSLGKKSEAKAEIWQEWDNFSELATQLESSSQQLHDAAGGDRKAEVKLFKQLTKNCSSCHDSYRIED